MRLLPVLALLVIFMFSAPGRCDESDEDAWIFGTWQLTYDPDAAETDWLEFLPDGEVYNITPDGDRTPGLYLVTGDEVKAVFTLNEKDVIMFFHTDAKRDVLRIVTSNTGVASVYRKVGSP